MFKFKRRQFTAFITAKARKADDSAYVHASLTKLADFLGNLEVFTLYANEKGPIFVPVILSACHRREKRDLIAVLNEFIMFGMFLIDGSTNDVFMLECSLIFVAERFQMSNKVTDADRLA